MPCRALLSQMRAAPPFSHSSDPHVLIWWHPTAPSRYTEHLPPPLSIPVHSPLPHPLYTPLLPDPHTFGPPSVIMMPVAADYDRNFQPPAVCGPGPVALPSAPFPVRRLPLYPSQSFQIPLGQRRYPLPLRLPLFPGCCHPTPPSPQPPAAAEPPYTSGGAMGLRPRFFLFSPVLGCGHPSAFDLPTRQQAPSCFPALCFRHDARPRLLVSETIAASPTPCVRGPERGAAGIAVPQ